MEVSDQLQVSTAQRPVPTAKPQDRSVNGGGETNPCVSRKSTPGLPALILIATDG